MNGKVDWSEAFDAVGGSLDLLLEIIDIFLDEYPKLMTGIQSSIESEAHVELRRSAHTLKGNLRYFGVLRAAELSAEVENMGRDKQIARANEVFAQLQLEMDAVLAELKAFVASQRPGIDA